jgi:hypothetical protein
MPMLRHQTLAQHPTKPIRRRTFPPLLLRLPRLPPPHSTFHRTSRPARDKRMWRCRAMECRGCGDVGRWSVMSLVSIACLFTRVRARCECASVWARRLGFCFHLRLHGITQTQRTHSMREHIL